MNKILTGALLASLTASGAFAAGLDRSGQDVSVIFENGNLTQLSFGYVEPSVSGKLGPFDSGDAAKGYTQFGAAYKAKINDQIDIALIYDQPFGANVDYSKAGYPLLGAKAEVTSSGLTFVGKYKLSENFSVLAGLRSQSVKGDVSVPAVGGYTLSAQDTDGFGYLAGVAYERPDIALRVSAVYNSPIEHSMTGTEFGASTNWSMKTPASFNLNAQTGIAPGTLLFGSVRWVDWDSFNITPAAYPLGSLVSYKNDGITYNLGIGRQFSDQFSGSVSIGYEESKGGTVSDLGPTDGFLSLQVGGRYKMDNVTISGGVRYVAIGDATTSSGASFKGNSAIGLGLSVNIAM